MSTFTPLTPWPERASGYSPIKAAFGWLLFLLIPSVSCDGKWVLEVAPGCIDVDGDGFSSCEDCDDDDPSIHPDAVELCDGTDNNCDGRIDEDVQETFFVDDDGDGFGSEAEGVQACAPPDGFVPTSGDCDDGAASRHPGAEEYCNGVDDDCDGTIDEDAVDMDTFHADADGDGYGDPDSTTDACEQPKGYVEDAGDCDDTDAAFNPGAKDFCDDPNDYNCDGSVGYADVDGDGWAACEECDDADAAINPDATEICDGADNDCDGTVDEDDAADASAWYADTDSDGFGDLSSSTLACDQPTGYVSNDSDCDADDASVNPAATEICDGIDNDCDTLIDEDNAADASVWYADTDGDGYGDAASTTLACLQPTGYVSNDSDCDDTDAAINPAATEVCDFIDNDCDGDTDEDDASDAATWYADDDGDSFGDADSTTLACEQPSGYVALSGPSDTDCDDSDAAINPDATEVCDGADNDCDGTVDEDDAADASTWYADDDGDTYGDLSVSTQTCDVPSGYVADNDDCDDSDADVNPAATEICDSVDNDCDSLIDDDDSSVDLSTGSTFYADDDGDGYGDAGTTALTCDIPSGYVTDDTDCDDDDAAINPAASERLNGQDDDCSGDADWTVSASTADATLYGIAMNDYAGISVAFVGDTNGDGYDDFVIGASFADTVDSDTGGVYLMRGPVSGTVSLTSADATLYGEASGDLAGSAVAGGDNDGDGLDDVLIAADWSDSNGTTSGTVYLKYGPMSGSIDLGYADAVLQGEDAHDMAGSSITMSGDADGDGMEDILIGAVASNDYGTVHLLLGPVSGTIDLGDADVILTAESTKDYVGDSVAFAGDLNGDGAEDLLIGAPMEDSAGDRAGAVYIVFGPVTANMSLADADAKLTGQNACDLAGGTVAGLGDVDGDGTDDFAVSSDWRCGGSNPLDTTFVVLGAVSGTSTLSVAESSYTAEASGDWAGCDVAGGADIDGDGLGDMVVGAISEDTVGSDGGAVYVLTGITSGSHSLADTTSKLIGPSKGSGLGSSLSLGGDTDADGVLELLVGAYSDDTAASGAGAVRIFELPWSL